jgi:dihydroneopterin aldolase
VARQVEKIVAGDPVDLLETLAVRIADACLAHRGVTAAEVTVHKPMAPIGIPFDDVAVTVRRSR